MKVKYTRVLQVWTTVQHKNCERKLASGKVIVFYFEDFSTTACMLLVFMTNRCTSITDPHSPCFPKRLHNSVIAHFAVILYENH